MQADTRADVRENIAGSCDQASFASVVLLADVKKGRALVLRPPHILSLGKLL